jgi:hypothetical protein
MTTLTLAPFGLRWSRQRRASAGNFQANVFYIKKGYASAIGFGDLVCTGTSGNQGYVVPYVEGGSAVLGVFAGFPYPYFDTVLNAYSLKQWWAGTESPNADVACLVIDDPDAVFVAQVSGGPTVQADRGLNIDVTGNGAPNTTTGLSTGALDYTQKGTTSTFPLRIIGFSQMAFPGYDPTNPLTQPTNNYAEVILNPGASEWSTGTGV